MKPMTAVHALWFAGALMSAAPVFAAESATLQTEAQQTDTLAARHGATRVESRIAGDFTAFAGSEANAQNLVTGLRNGTPITLTGTSSTGGTSTTTLIIDNPTRPMGYGNVTISLALAKQQLASYGITNPTAEQLQAALTGGTITTSSGQTVTLNGILTQRAAGMGWGAIANAQGVKLGQVISGLKSTNARIASTTTTTTTAGSGGVTTATGARVQSNAAAGAPGQNRSTATTGSGIVTATGSRPAVGVGIGAGASANAGGGGIVTGAGTAASVQGGARGALMGQGQGQGKP
jgi:hypothetical protein